MKSPLPSAHKEMGREEKEIKTQGGCILAWKYHLKDTRSLSISAPCQREWKLPNAAPSKLCILYGKDGEVNSFDSLAPRRRHSW